MTLATTFNAMECQSYWRYIDLLNQAKTAAKMPPLAAMDAVMLEAVATPWARGKPMQVLEAMTSCKEISTTTAHRVLKRLRIDGWIALTLDRVDNRIKYISLTEQGEKYFSLHSQCMDKAQKKK